MCSSPLPVPQPVQCHPCLRVTGVWVVHEGVYVCACICVPVQLACGCAQSLPHFQIKKCSSNTQPNDLPQCTHTLTHNTHNHTHSHLPAACKSLPTTYSLATCVRCSSVSIARWLLACEMQADSSWGVIRACTNCESYCACLVNPTESDNQIARLQEDCAT